MAGAAGFEPANDGTKTRCLTTWRRPITTVRALDTPKRNGGQRPPFIFSPEKMRDPLRPAKAGVIYLLPGANGAGKTMAECSAAW